MEITQANADDPGSYRISAKNIHGSVSCRCNLTVDRGIRAYIAPEFDAPLPIEPIAVKEGGEITLSAHVEAYPTVDVMWYRDEVSTTITIF